MTRVAHIVNYTAVGWPYSIFLQTNRSIACIEAGQKFWIKKMIAKDAVELGHAISSYLAGGIKDLSQFEFYFFWAAKPGSLSLTLFDGFSLTSGE